MISNTSMRLEYLLLDSFGLDIRGLEFSEEERWQVLEKALYSLRLSEKCKAKAIEKLEKEKRKLLQTSIFSITGGGKMYGMD